MTSSWPFPINASLLSNIPWRKEIYLHKWEEGHQVIPRKSAGPPHKSNNSNPGRGDCTNCGADEVGLGSDEKVCSSETFTFNNKNQLIHIYKTV